MFVCLNLKEATVHLAQDWLPSPSGPRPTTVPVWPKTRLPFPPGTRPCCGSGKYTLNKLGLTSHYHLQMGTFSRMTQCHEAWIISDWHVILMEVTVRRWVHCGSNFRPLEYFIRFVRVWYNLLKCSGFPSFPGLKSSFFFKTGVKLIPRAFFVQKAMLAHVSFIFKFQKQVSVPSWLSEQKSWRKKTWDAVLYGVFGYDRFVDRVASTAL